MTAYKRLMKSFKLQAVLDHRQRIEDKAKQSLAQAIQHEHLLMDKITDATGDLAEICRTYEQRQEVGMHGHEFALYENSISHTRQLLIDLDRQLGEARQQVLQARQQLAEASREKKLLGKLKEKKLSEMQKELQRREMIEIDEIAIMFRREDK